MRFVLPAWGAFLVAVSLLPVHLKGSLHMKGTMHYGAHFFVFIVTALLVCWKPVTFSLKLAWAGAACCVVTFLEVLEAVWFHNRVEWLDVWTGCLGVAAGLILIVIVQGTLTPPDPYENRG